MRYSSGLADLNQADFESLILITIKIK